MSPWRGRFLKKTSPLRWRFSLKLSSLRWCFWYCQPINIHMSLKIGGAFGIYYLVWIKVGCEFGMVGFLLTFGVFVWSGWIFLNAVQMISRKWNCTLTGRNLLFLIVTAKAVSRAYLPNERKVKDVTLFFSTRWEFVIERTNDNTP